jgi:hypothetical protein
MKQVFVHSLSNNLWKVIDKATGETIEHINDVMIFNGEFKRYNGIKGWNGILSEEMNTKIIDLMNKPLKIITSLICSIVSPVALSITFHKLLDRE